MSKITKETVDSLADKLLIGLSPEENKMVLDEFEFIETNMALINKIEGIDSIEPMTHPFDLYESSMREDVKDESIAIEEILRNADKIEGREIEVPKVVGE